VVASQIQRDDQLAELALSRRRRTRTKEADT
jgi:hypothetical protein